MFVSLLVFYHVYQYIVGSVYWRSITLPVVITTLYVVNLPVYGWLWVQIICGNYQFMGGLPVYGWFSNLRMVYHAVSLQWH